MKRLVVLLPAVLLLLGCERPQPPAAYVNVDNVRRLQEEFQGGGDAKGPAAEQSAAAEPTGWATVRGRFKIAGAVPPKTVLKVDKETEICAPGGKQVFSDALRTDAQGNLQDVVVYLVTPLPADDPKWEHESYTAKKTETVEFDQKACMFLSHVFAMRSTQTVKVLNSDPIGHNTKIDAKDKAKPANITVAANSFQTYVPGGASQQPFPVSCSIHPWMSAYMLVRDNGYVGVSDAAGTFAIANVPAGVPLEFRVWHEVYGYLGKVTLNGAAVSLAKGKMKPVVLKPDEELELNFELSAP